MVPSSVGLSVAVPDVSSVTSTVTGGGDAATFVLVAPPPQAASAIAANISIDKSTLNFRIPFTPYPLNLAHKKYITLTEHRLLPILDLQVLE
jgi:hypothetical protein